MRFSVSPWLSGTHLNAPSPPEHWKCSDTQGPALSDITVVGWNNSKQRYPPLTAFTGVTVSGRDSIDTRPRRRPWCRRVSKPIASRVTNAGVRKHGAFEWFLRRNDLNVPIYDPITGGCRDGLHRERANEHQGAESTLAFLQALLELRLVESASPVTEARSPVEV